jgi:glycosyltransferase involved in cell wall biosynthesis
MSIRRPWTAAWEEVVRVGVLRSVPWGGGGRYIYETVLMEALAEVARRSPHQIECLIRPDENVQGLMPRGKLNFDGLPLTLLSPPKMRVEPLEVYLNQPARGDPGLNPDVIYYDADGARKFREFGADWLFQLQPNPTSFAALMPFVMPIHDLQHRFQPEFPEVREDGQLGFREYLYRNACRYATLLLVDSHQGKQDVLDAYGAYAQPDRIRVLPFYPPFERSGVPSAESLARVAREYQLPPRFFFYPAQFWRHKNHHLIVEALSRIASASGLRIPVVFCGVYNDRLTAMNFNSVMQSASELGVRDLVHYLGWVTDRDMAALFSLSVGLVMPTFFGPTNLPPLEAWFHNRPVITSDLPGIREQTGDGGILVDPRSPEQLAQAMLRLWQDRGLSDRLAANGQRRLKAYSWDDFVHRVAEVVDDASSMIQGGRSPRYPTVAPG